MVVACFLLAYFNSCDARKAPPSKYEDHYNKFLSEHFADTAEKYVDGKDEYKSASNEKEDDEEEHDEAEEEHEESNDEKSNDDDDDEHEEVEDHDFVYRNNNDYERIKALSEKQVAELHKKPGNCKNYEKDGMVCSVCVDPDTGDTSEVCAK